MRKVLLVLLWAVMSSCEKGDAIHNDVLEGTWNWVHKQGGIAGISETPREGDIFLLQLNADKTFSRKRNDTLVASGDYTLSTGKSYLFNENVRYITFGANETLIYDIKGNELYLTEDVSDGFVYKYVRW